MSEVTNATTTTPEAPAPPDDFNEYETWRAAQDKAGDEPAGESESDDADKDAKPTDDPKADPAEAGEDDPEGDGDGDTAADENKPKRKGGYQRRIDKLTREKRELEARLAQTESGRKGGEGGNDDASKQTEEASAKPKVEDFDSYEEFTEALTDWKLEQRAKADADKRANESRQAQAEQAQNERLKGWNDRQEGVRKAHSDYDDTLAAVDDIEIPPYLQEALLDSEVGPALAYKLAKDPDELERIVALPAASALRELGRLEASMEAPAAKPKTNGAAATAAVSRAPKPVAPLRPRGGAAADIHDPALAEDFNAWEKVRNRQLKE